MTNSNHNDSSSAFSAFNSSEELIEEIRQGRMVILIDDEDRENEGDLVLAADFVTPEAINFMATEARGLICLALAPEQIDRLQLPQMVRDEQNYSPNKTAFTVSIEASSGVSTGISASDRAHTIRIASNPQAKPSDVRFPGHVFPIRAQHGGVLRRAGHTEGSVDLTRLAGLGAAAVICEIMNPDGTMARVPDLKAYAKKHKIKIGTIVDLIQYRLSRELLVEETFDQVLPEAYAGLRARVFKSKVDQLEHLVLQKGNIEPNSPVLVRMQTDAYTREMFTLLRRGDSYLQSTLEYFEQQDSAVLVLLRGNNRGTGLAAELKNLIEPANKREMDHRDYGIGAQILRALGAQQIRLLTNHPDRKIGLRAFGIEIVEVVNFHQVKENLNGEEKNIYCAEGAKNNSKAKGENSEEDSDPDDKSQNRNRNVTVQSRNH